MPKKPSHEIDPHLIFRQAERYHMASHHLRNVADIPTLALLSIPSLTTSAFASELYLKCLQCIQNGSWTDGHHLKNIFRNLDKSTRKRVSDLWDEEISKISWQFDIFEKGREFKLSRDLESLLTEGSQGYTSLRYIFEGSKDSGFGLQQLPDVLRRTIAEKKPEWFSSGPSAPFDPSPFLVKPEDLPPGAPGSIAQSKEDDD